MVEECKREVLWDAIRGFGMILVILGHMDIATEVIYSFHMPLFFFLSGVLYRTRNRRRVVSYIIRRMYIPYFIWSVSLSVFGFLAYKNWGIGNEKQFGDLKVMLFNILLGGGAKNTISASPAIWYLTAAASILLIYTCIEEMKNEVLKATVVFLCAVLGVCLSRNGCMGVYNVVVALVAMPFYYVGKQSAYFKSFLSKIRKYHIYLGIICAVVCFFGAKYNGKVHIYRGELGYSSILFYINAFMGIVASISLIQIVVSSKLLKIVCFLLSEIGKKSLGIMCIHMILIYMCKSVINNPCSLFIVVLICSYAIALVWERLYAKFLSYWPSRSYIC